ncbi:MAG: outer membrane beta-barrel family protein [Lutibacter sp.]
MSLRIEIIFFLFIYNTVFTQNKFNVSGILTNQKDTLTTAGDAFLLTETGGELVKYTSINEGRFSIKSILKGTYLLKISCLGFEDYEQKIVLDKNIEIKMTLKERLTQLSEVQIIASKKPIENKNGNIIVNVENTIFSKEANLIGLLSKLPYIQIDPNKESINIIGKGNPLIYLGKQRISIDELNSIVIDNIKNIEIINNPSAKYEAEGRAVILITQKTNNQEGLKISLSETASFRKYFNNFFSSNLSLKKNKFEVKFNASYNKLKFWESNEANYQITDRNVTSNYLVEAVSPRKEYIIGGGIYYQINNTDYFSISSKLRTQNEIFPIITSSYFKENSNENTVKSFSENDSKRLFSSTNINYSKLFKKLGNLFLGGQYTNYNQNLESQISNNFNNTSFEVFQNRFQDFTIKSATLKGDYEKKFNEKIKLEIGANFLNTTSYSKTEIKNWNPQNTNNSNYDYSEKSKAFYSQLSWKLKKINYDIGLRVEKTHIKGKFTDSDEFLINRKNTDIFPKVSVNFPIDSTATISFNYSKSIQRPNYSKASSITVFINPFLEFSNNINLKSTLTDEISINFQLKDKSITASYYNTENPVHYSLIYDADTDKTIMFPSNFKKEYGMNLDLTIPLKIKIWNSTNVLSFVVNTIDDPKATNLKTRPYLYFYSNNQFKIDNSSSIGINGWGLTKRNEGIFKRNALFVLNASVTKKFFDKLDTTLSFNDIFNNLQYKESYLLQNIEAESTFYTDRDKISISLKYSFGEIKNIAYKNKDVDDNLNRVK